MFPWQVGRVCVNNKGSELILWKSIRGSDVFVYLCCQSVVGKGGVKLGRVHDGAKSVRMFLALSTCSRLSYSA